MNKVKIVADSTCDLSPELLQRYQVDIVPLYVNLNQETYRDGIDIVPDQIYAWVEEHKTTPKTAAITQVDVAAVFQKYVSQGYQVFYTGISGDMSASYQIAKLAASDFPENSIAVLDSRNLSTGIGHTVIRAAELAEAGMSCMQFKEELEENFVSKVRASFVVDSITYLYRGGRCSAVAAFGATALNLKPEIIVQDGKMRPNAKYRGRIDKALLKYVKAMEDDLLKARKDRVFITHSGCAQETIDKVYQYLKELNYFDEILITRAGCVISSHCGYGTLGVLFVEQ